MILEPSRESGRLRNTENPASKATADAVRRSVHRAEKDAEHLDADSAVLHQRVRLFLDGSHIPTLRRVAVEINGDAVLLRGTVRSYHEKQIAIQFASRVAGVRRVIDMIEVPAYVPLSRLGLGDSNDPRSPRRTR